MELENVVEKRPRRQTFAQAVSAIIHPVAFPLLTLAAITFTQTGSLRTTAIICLVALALTTAPVAALVGFQVARGHWTDLDVSVRQQRYALYPVGLLFELLLVGALALMRAPQGAIVAALAMTLANAVDGVINFAYKVSAHATSAATCAALLWLFVPGWGAPATLAAALVGWSRVELGRHTTGQVALGWLVGVAGALAAQALFI
ncbi:MAG TPA: phosphatase PAP2 family protein [Ktedonobacterales bacterium]|jgi:membrane-associated phospholipid phosphatase|nr:phosphatase PAP2 family protein [Ktedonobacterales bacterium]